jgi:hypothetical protein
LLATERSAEASVQRKLNQPTVRADTPLSAPILHRNAHGSERSHPAFSALAPRDSARFVPIQQNRSERFFVWSIFPLNKPHRAWMSRCDHVSDQPVFFNNRGLPLWLLQAVWEAEVHRISVRRKN